MKIAIKGHESRGKEVIQTLESLGGKNTKRLTGTLKTFYFINNKNVIDHDHKDNFPLIYKYYTLEEFEKEFPFKIGDEVVWNKDNYTAVRTVLGIDYSDLAGIKYAITAFGAENCFWEVDVNELKLYKKMKKERNITLTLDKAKEWYKKGGELREIALQAFTEKELNPLPRSWEEYNRSYGGVCLSTRYTNTSLKNHDALLKLEQLRDCWRRGWKPNWNNHSEKWCICLCGNELSVSITTIMPRFLTFPTKEMAEEFLECFKDLIEKAGDLI